MHDNLILMNALGNGRRRIECKIAEQAKAKDKAAETSLLLCITMTWLVGGKVRK